MDDVHEPVGMDHVSDLIQEPTVPHVFGIRLVPDPVNHCGETDADKRGRIKNVASS